MQGLLINQKELQELQYLIKRELDEILFDLRDHRINQDIKKAMDERYTVLFSLFKRVASHKECLTYMRPRKRNANQG